MLRAGQRTDDARMSSPAARPGLLVLLGAALVTVLAYGAVVVVTAFVSCGISGCSGGGFGPAFSPGETQVGLLVSGLVPVPLVLLLLRGRRPAVRAGAGLAAVVAGAVLTMAVTGLGPHGCPLDRSRTVRGPSAYKPGSATCSGDRHAIDGGASGGSGRATTGAGSRLTTGSAAA